MICNSILGMKVQNQQSETGEFSYEPNKPIEGDYQPLHRSQKSRCKFESRTDMYGVKCLDPGLVKLKKKYDDTVMLYPHKCEKPCSDFAKRADEIDAQERADAELTVNKKRLPSINMYESCLPVRGKPSPALKESKLTRPHAKYPSGKDPKQRSCPEPCKDEVVRMDDVMCWKPKRKKLPTMGSKIAVRNYSTHVYPKGKPFSVQNFFTSKRNTSTQFKQLETKNSNYFMTKVMKVTTKFQNESLKLKPSPINISYGQEKLRKSKNVCHLGSVQALKPVGVNWEIPPLRKFRYHSKDLRKHLLHIPIPLTCFYEGSLRCAVRRFATCNSKMYKEEKKKIRQEFADRFSITNITIKDHIEDLQPRKIQCKPVNKISPPFPPVQYKKSQPENNFRRSLRLSAKRSMEKIPRKRSNTRNRKSFLTKTKPIKSLSCTDTKKQRILPPYCCFTDHNPKWSSRSELSFINFSKIQIPVSQQYSNLRRAYSTKSKLAKKSSEPSNKTANKEKLLKRTTSSLFQSLDRRISTRSRLNLIQKTTGRKISFIQTDQIGKLNKKYYVHAVTRKLKPKEDIVQSSRLQLSTKPKLNPQEQTTDTDRSPTQKLIDKSFDTNVDFNNFSKAAKEKTASGSQKVVERQTSIKTSKIPRLKKQADVHSNKKTDEPQIEQMGMNKNEVALIKNIIEFVSQNETQTEAITSPVFSKKKSLPIFPTKKPHKYPPSSNHEYLLRVLNVIEDNRKRENMPVEPLELQTSQEKTCDLCKKGDVPPKYWMKNQETNTPEKGIDFNENVTYLNKSNMISLKCLNKDKTDISGKESKEVLCEKSIKLVKFKGNEPIKNDEEESKTENYVFEKNVVLEPQTPDKQSLLVSEDTTTDMSHLKNKIEHIEKNLELVKELQKDSIQKIEEDKGHIIQSTKEVKEEVKKSVSEIVRNQRESLQEAKTQVQRALDLIRTTNVKTNDKEMGHEENKSALLKSYQGNKSELPEKTENNLLRQSLPGSSESTENKKPGDPISILKKIAANNPMVSNNLPQFKEPDENLTPAGGLKGLEWGTAVQQVHLKRGYLSNKIPLKGGITETEEMVLEVPIKSQRRLASGNAKGCKVKKASCEKPKMKCKIGPKKVNLCKKDEKKAPRIICTKKKSWFQRFLEYFKARPGCPSSEELRQKRLRLKAIRAAEAAGLNVCERKLDKCGQIQKLILVKTQTPKPSPPTPASKATCKEKIKAKSCKPKKKCIKASPPPRCLQKEAAPPEEKSKTSCCCSLPGKSKASNSSSRSFATKSDSKTSGPSCRRTQERNHSTYIGFNREPYKGLEFIQSHFPYKNFTHCPPRPNVYVGKMYEVKLSKIGVKNALIPRNPDEEPYTYCQICKIVPKGIVNKKVPDDPILMNINVEAKKSK